MRERKKFFVNNRLNKGYKRRFDTDLSDVEAFKKQNLQMLPPIEVIEQYESHYPGTFKKLMEMTQNEQKNRHRLAELEIEKNAKMSFYGRVTGIIYILILSLSVIVLALLGHALVASIFAISGFACLLLLARFLKKGHTGFREDRRRFKPFQQRGQNN